MAMPLNPRTKLREGILGCEDVGDLPCQSCDQRPARVKLMKILQGRYGEVLLCQACAQSLARESKDVDGREHVRFDDALELIQHPAVPSPVGHRVWRALRRQLLRPLF